MDGERQTSIREFGGYVHVDFGSSDRGELSETYRSFTRICIGKAVDGALLQAGDNDPDGHRRLGVALCEIAEAAGIAPHFRLALVPSTAPIRAIYSETQQALRAAGLDARVFDSVENAVQWLEGRLPPGPMVS